MISGGVFDFYGKRTENPSITTDEIKCKFKEDELKEKEISHAFEKMGKLWSFKEREREMYVEKYENQNLKESSGLFWRKKTMIVLVLND